MLRFLLIFIFTLKANACGLEGSGIGRMGSLYLQYYAQANNHQNQVAHETHSHVHKEGCGHKAFKHKDHIDYQHNGIYHRQVNQHIHYCEGPKRI